MIKENAIYERSDTCYLEELDDEILLYNPTKNVTLHFNESSALIWKMLRALSLFCRKNILRQKMKFLPTLITC